MTPVVAVHGINNTYLAPEVIARQWGPAMMGGLTLAGHEGLLAPEDVTYVFYGDVFRRPGRYLGTDDIDVCDEEEVLEPTELALLSQWWDAATASDTGVAPRNARTLGGVGVQAALAALANSHFLAVGSERLLLLWMKQVRAYFTQPSTRATIQVRMTEAIGADTRVIVAHSLGSVVAYEALAANPHWHTSALITLGSPLGIRNLILDRLSPPPRQLDNGIRGRWPGGVRNWTNVADSRDFVALVKKLHPVFGPEVVDVTISNGVQMHNVERYLTATETGAAIAQALRPAHGL